MDAVEPAKRVHARRAGALIASLLGGGPLELGRVPILEYHRVGAPEDRWTRTPEGLRADLERLHARGYRIVRLEDLIGGAIDLPAGTSPVVLTFDDSSPGQLRFLGPGEVDPSCAFAILEAFSRAHPDAGHGATFFVLPGASRPNRLFDQPEHARAKLRLLLDSGYEIGNHTLWHANLGEYGEETVRRQIAEAQRWIVQLVPDVKIRSFSLPFGVHPKEMSWIAGGELGGTRYHHDAVVEVSGGPAPSPFSRAFDPLHLPRVQVTGDALARTLDALEGRRFTSDGDPGRVTVPASLAKQVGKLPRGAKLVLAPGE